MGHIHTLRADEAARSLWLTRLGPAGVRPRVHVRLQGAAPGQEGGDHEDFVQEEAPRARTPFLLSVRSGLSDYCDQLFNKTNLYPPPNKV